MVILSYKFKIRTGDPEIDLPYFLKWIIWNNIWLNVEHTVFIENKIKSIHIGIVPEKSKIHDHCIYKWE